VLIRKIDAPTVFQTCLKLETTPCTSLDSWVFEFLILDLNFIRARWSTMSEKKRGDAIKIVQLELCGELSEWFWSTLYQPNVSLIGLCLRAQGYISKAMMMHGGCIWQNLPIFCWGLLSIFNMILHTLKMRTWPWMRRWTLVFYQLSPSKYLTRPIYTSNLNRYIGVY